MGDKAVLRPRAARSSKGRTYFVYAAPTPSACARSCASVCALSLIHIFPALLDEETRENEMMYPGADMLSRCETMEVLPDELNSAMDKEMCIRDRPQALADARGLAVQ